jgi:hypothetical protein
MRDRVVEHEDSMVGTRCIDEVPASGEEVVSMRSGMLRPVGLGFGAVW